MVYGWCIERLFKLYIDLVLCNLHAVYVLIPLNFSTIYIYYSVFKILDRHSSSVVYLWRGGGSTTHLEAPWE